MRPSRLPRNVRWPSTARRRAARLLGAMALCLVLAGPVSAHPAPFSYVNLHLAPDVVDVTIVVHVFDLAHDLPGESAESWLQPATLAQRGAEAVALVRSRFVLASGDARLTGAWFDPVPSDETDAVVFRARFAVADSSAPLRVEARLFPYDPVHQTFVNVYDVDRLRTQAVLSASEPVFVDTGARIRIGEVVARFVPSGVHHILIGPDHVLFLVGLLLPGGSWRRLAWIVTAFTVAHSVTLSLAALSIVLVPSSLIEPAIALSIIYVGIDNLLVGDGRDARTWSAFAFGLIHGFGFASVLREMALPRQALVASLVSFNVGVEIGQLIIVALVATALTAVRVKSPSMGRVIRVAGSMVVMAAGVFWFVQRVFLDGGTG